ncbi:MAG: RNA polymerase sigma factor [Defluviitaleaceae bacterium]|nr:RNA polymerase sigma factor [Defluviitaleaceae bacterium]
MDDHAIIALYFARDEAALEATRRKYGNRLFRCAMNILFNAQDAEECVSDAFFKAWKAIPPASPEMLGAFLAKIVRNLSINKLEARSAAKRGGDEARLFLGEMEECLPSPAGGPEDEFEARSVTNAINSFLSNANKTARAAFVLRYFHGESIGAIAGRFQISESNVKSTLFRTRKKLRLHLEKEGVLI